MVEVVSGLQTTLSNLLSGGYTFKGKPLEFKQVENAQGLVFQASTNCTDEDIALGNNDFIASFSLSEALGTIIVSQVPIDDKERAEIAKDVKEKKAKLKEGDEFEAKQLNRAQISTAQESKVQNEKSGDNEDKEINFGKGSTVNTSTSTSTKSSK